MKLKHAAAVAALAAGALMVLADNPTAKKSHDAAVARNLTTFNALVKELELNYVDSTRPDEAFRAAINAYLSLTDPYTEYYSSDDQQALSTLQTGEYAGIGSYIEERPGKITLISAPYKNSPAHLAGLRPGDRIIRIDTTDTQTIGSSEVSKLLRGAAGSKVNVQVIRPYVADSILDFTLERRKVQIPNVTYAGMIDGRTGYINLTSFVASSPKEVGEALEKFKANPELKEVVLDLRGNGGGLLEAAVDIAGFFLPKGTEVLRTRGRDKSTEKIYKTTNTPILPDIPLAILIDGGSASSSEIVAGAMQDLDRAVLVGTRSFGKGLVQGTRMLPYDGALKVTAAKYYIPSGRCIQVLDYSRRNPDGSVAHMPDSLTSVFHTAHGREVRDGGGLKPDSTVSWGEVNRLVYNLVRDNIISDFRTKYASEHDSIAPPETFTVTDEIFEEFKKFIDPSKLKYDKVCEDIMTQLRKAAEMEGYMNDDTKSALDTLGKLLTHDLNHDLDRHRDQISEYIATELMRTYYFDSGATRNSLNNDPGMKKALEILRDPAKLNATLGLAKTAKSK